MESDGDNHESTNLHYISYPDVCNNTYGSGGFSGNPGTGTL